MLFVVRADCPCMLLAGGCFPLLCAVRRFWFVVDVAGCCLWFDVVACCVLLVDRGCNLVLLSVPLHVDDGVAWCCCNVLYRRLVCCCVLSLCVVCCGRLLIVCCVLLLWLFVVCCCVVLIDAFFWGAVAVCRPCCRCLLLFVSDC